MSSNILHTFSVQTEVETKVDLLQHVRKLISYGRYSTQLSDDGINIAFASSKELDASQNVSIINRSNSILENSLAATSKEETFTAKEFSTRYRNFLVTNIYTPTLTSQETKPLYYKHTLPPDTIIGSIQVLDSNFAVVSSYLYNIVIEYKNGDSLQGIEFIQVYNDFANYFNETTGELLVYFVKYRNSTGNHSCLLNNKPAYVEATFDDFDWITFEIFAGKKAYVINEVTDSFLITMPEEDSYSLRYENQVRIQLFPSLVNDVDQGWFPRVSYGSFITWDGNEKYTYEIPEFNAQHFNPFPPYKLVPFEKIGKIGNGLIRLEHTPSAIGNFPNITLFLDLLIEDQNENPLYALTTNTSKDGRVYEKKGEGTSVCWDTSRILSYDNNTGIIHVDLDVKDYHVIYATYYYEEKFLELNNINLNPLMNSEVQSGMYSIYLVPKISGGGLLNSIEWLKIDSQGIITAQSQEKPSFIGWTYGRPDISSQSFLYRYSVEGRSGGDCSNNFKYLILGEITVNKTSDATEVVSLDTRERGGGIKEELVDGLVIDHPEVQLYTDIGFGGGIPFPGQSVVVVRLPRTLLTTYGGRFTEEDLKLTIKRHLAFGHYPLIRYYDPNEIIITPVAGFSSNISGVHIKWRGNGIGWTASVDGINFSNIDNHLRYDGPFVYFDPTKEFDFADQIQIKNGNKYSNVVYLLIR